MKLLTTLAATLLCITGFAQTQRTETILKDWNFRKGHDIQATEGWEAVKVPHDWAIYGPFDRQNDLQRVAVVQNGEYVPSDKTGRTGGLPYMGQGAYVRNLEIAETELDGRRHTLLFDGAMSEAQIFVNGEKVCFWPYGYNSFHCDITENLKPGSNEIAVLLENRPQSSRWYPGAGLYRKVRHITLPQIHVPIWGTYVTTPYVGSEYATVRVRTKVNGVEKGSAVTLKTRILDAEGNEVACETDTRPIHNGEIEQNITVSSPQLWSPETPTLYFAETEVYTGGSIDTAWEMDRPEITVTHGDQLQDKVSTRFGFRTIVIRPDKGFFLNGQARKFRGVCQHHDLGPLGAAVNKAALRRQLTILKDMGCDAIRTSHNMPA
jgi:beta-galactosidase